MSKRKLKVLKDKLIKVLASYKKDTELEFSDISSKMITFQKPKKYSINLWGHQTSLTLEPDFWEELRVLARKKNLSLKKLVESIDEQRTQQENSPNLSSCLRLWILHQKLK